MEENLIRFEESKVSQNQQLSSPIFETSQVSKINSIDYRLGERKSSLKREEESDNGYENRAPSNYTGGYTRYSKKGPRAASINRELSSIDEKFNKYVSKQNSSKAIPRPSTDVYSVSSRQATGKFGYEERTAGAIKNQYQYDSRD